MELYWIWFAGLPGGPAVRSLLLQQFHDPEELFFASDLPEGIPEELKQALLAKDLGPARAILNSCTKSNIYALPMGDDRYPERLRQIDDPPPVLYYRGRLPDWEARPFVGVVGTRKATLYGLQTAFRLGRQIAEHGGCVVSGGAAGIDTRAMEGALEGGLSPVAVLGCGPDVVYPRSNRKLFDAVAEEGCLISEYPPGTQGIPWHFPRRNRILSGLSHAVLVVEAPEKSGALITAQCALSQGRELYAVPANVGVAAYEGSNGLLQSGAAAVLNGWDAVKSFAIQFPHTVRQQPERIPAVREKTDHKVAQDPVIPESLNKLAIDNKETTHYSVLNDTRPGLTEEEQSVLALLSPEVQHSDLVCANSELPPAKVQSILTKLILLGLVQHHPGGCVSLK